MYDTTEIILTDGNLRVVARLSDFSVPSPDYCGSDILLSWNRRDWHIGWKSCDGHDSTCPNAHPIDPETVLNAARMFDTETFQRWLNIVSPTGIRYYVSEAHGYSQGDDYLLIEAIPAEVAYVPDPNNHEAVNWARGDVYHLEVEHRDAEDDDWMYFDNDCVVYGLSGAMDLAEDSIVRARRILTDIERREADLTAMYI